MERNLKEDLNGRGVTNVTKDVPEIQIKFVVDHLHCPFTRFRVLAQYTRDSFFPTSFIRNGKKCIKKDLFILVISDQFCYIQKSKSNFGFANTFLTAKMPLNGLCIYDFPPPRRVLDDYSVTGKGNMTIEYCQNICTSIHGTFYMHLKC